MPTLNLEMEVTDFAKWRAGFARGEAAREQGGVLLHRVWRVVGDPAAVVVNLDFTSAQEAQEFLDMLRSEIWVSGDVAPTLVGTPKVRLLEPVADG